MSEQFDRQDSFGWMINVVAHDAAKRFEIELKKHGLTVALCTNHDVFMGRRRRNTARYCGEI